MISSCSSSVRWADGVEFSSFQTDGKTELGAMAEVKNRHIRAPFPA